MSITSPTSPFSSPIYSPPPAMTASRYHPVTNACHCLNLQLTVTPLTASPTASSASHTPTPTAAPAQHQQQQSQHSLLHALTADPTSPFYAHHCLLAHMDSKSIQQEALTAVRAFSVASTHWVLFRCLGCRMDCFAVEADGADGRCVMRLDMLSNDDISELHTSTQYSTAFNVIVPMSRSSPLTSPSGVVGGGGGTGALGSAAESLRVALDRSIHAEQLAVQMRINQLVAEEQARFAAWEKKGRRELTQLLAFLQETGSGRPSLSGDVPGSPYVPRSPAPTPISPRPTSPTSTRPASVFQPLHTFLRRPSRQSPRLQRLLMDGLRHSSTMSPTDSHSPAVSTRTLDASDDDSGSTPRHNAPALSSSLPRTGRMSPRQSVSGLAVPQLSGLIRRGSRADDVEEDGDGDGEARQNSSTDMIVRWREQDEERQREEDRRSGQAKQRRSAAQRRKAASGGGQQQDEDQQDDEEEIFQLDTTSTEDSWVGEEAEQEDDDDDDDHDGLSTRHEEKERRESRVLEVMDDADNPQDGQDEADADEVHEDGALSDDEAVATTSQADILAIARRSSVSFVPIPSAASRSASSRVSGRQLGLVPSSLPIPIPAPLRQLIKQQQQQQQQHQDSRATTLSASLSRQPAPIPASSRAGAFSSTAMSSSVFDGPRRSSLHALALERKQLLNRSQPITEATTRTAQRTLSPEPPHAATTAQQPAAAAQSQAQADSDAEPFIPPHTLADSEAAWYAKFRHLADVKVAGSVVGGGGGLGSGVGTLSSSVPSRSMMSQVLFKKDDEPIARNRGPGASALSAALGGRKSSGGSGV